MSMTEEFKKFVLRGNVIDMAVGVIIGGAFNKIVSSTVSDVLMPPLGLLLGKVDFTNLFVNLSGTAHRTIDEAQKSGDPVLRYGVFLQSVFDFLIVAIVIFFVIKGINRLSAKAPPPAAAPSTKECSECTSAIPIKAKRCPHCTAVLA